jgi:beta-fructofuranosidase
MPATCLVETTVTFDADVHEVGLLLRTQPGLDGYYRIRLQPGRQRAVFDRYRTLVPSVPGSHEAPYLAERPVVLWAGKPVTVRVIADGSAMVTYIGDEVALSMRGYDFQAGGAGVYLAGGTASFTGTSIRRR